MWPCIKFQALSTSGTVLGLEERQRSASASMMMMMMSPRGSHHLQSFTKIRNHRRRQRELQKLMMQSAINIDGSTPLKAIASNPFPEPPKEDSIAPCKSLIASSFLCSYIHELSSNFRYYSFLLDTTLAALLDDDDDENLENSLLQLQSSRLEQKRGVLPRFATNVMRSWLFQHIVVIYHF